MKSKILFQTASAVIASVLLLLTSEVSGTASCLYCRRSDFAATLLVSYSYCASSDTCLQDRWLYIDRNCASDWKAGKDLNMIDDCKPKRTTCHPFVSKEQAAGQFFNFTETLGANEYCQIDIDATAFVARVVLDDALTLGAYANGEYLKIGKVLDIENGKTSVFAYNGDTSGSITFTLAFRNALQLTVISAIVLFSTLMTIQHF
jgi:hypothetical protein